MSAFAFDTLKFVRRLTDAGIPQLQAEAQAEVMSEAFVFNMDKLVTRDYLDARFAQQEARTDSRFAQIEKQLFLHTWILAVIAATTVIPVLTKLFNP
ncbi:MAG: hypothetical protein V7742_00415 [Halioglobus sp.]|jgi:hypothetical protein